MYDNSFRSIMDSSSVLWNIMGISVEEFREC
jgi:hypothetical protein